MEYICPHKYKKTLFCHEEIRETFLSLTTIGGAAHRLGTAVSKPYFDKITTLSSPVTLPGTLRVDTWKE